MQETNDKKLTLIEALGFFACMVCVAQKMFEQIKDYYQQKQNECSLQSGSNNQE